MDDDGIPDAFVTGDPGPALAAVLACLVDSAVWLDLELRVQGLTRARAPYPRSHMLGRCVLEFLSDEQRPIAEAAYAKVRDTLEPVSFRTRVLAGAAANSIFETRIAPLLREGQLAGYIAIASNITQHHNDKLNVALAVRATGMGLWSLDVQRNVSEWNAEMCAVMGRTVPLNIEAYVTEAVHPDDRAFAMEQSSRTMETGVFESAPHRIVRPDGEIRWVMVMGTVEMSSQGEPRFVHGALIDLTEQKRQEEAVQAAKKLQAVGQLAAGVAHNFNNLLSVISPSLEHWEKVAQASDVQIVQDARLAVDRAVELVQQLVSFARLSGEETPLELELHQVIKDSLRLSRRIVGKTLTIHEPVVPHGLRLLSPEGQLEQILINLAVNARDALVDSGKARGNLHVQVRSSGSMPPPSTRGTVPAKSFVRIEVRDDGPGMPPEVRARIFDPFFTTKEPGRGTGLGLSTAYAAVARLGGSIECESQPGHGTLFVLLLPVVSSS